MSKIKIVKIISKQVEEPKPGLTVGTFFVNAEIDGELKEEVYVSAFNKAVERVAEGCEGEGEVDNYRQGQGIEAYKFRPAFAQGQRAGGGGGRPRDYSQEFLHKVPTTALMCACQLAEATLIGRDEVLDEARRMSEWLREEIKRITG